MPGWPLTNALLQALEPGEAARLAPALETVALRVGDVISEPGQAVDSVVFPLGGIVSLSYIASPDTSTAVALVGHEGVVGIGRFMSGAGMPLRAEVIAPGKGLRLHGDVVDRERGMGGRLHSLALGYIHALTTQMAQTAVCNRHHAVNEQLCRWLLHAYDRVDGAALRLTQEQIANLMGVRREGVTDAAGRLQDGGVIRYSRGLIHLLDRPALEQRACECYATVRQQYGRLLLPRESLR